tara:strand:+ start:226 stop:405 length:180 start_codon:yes stop_codon:yes gene_type:complete
MTKARKEAAKNILTERQEKTLARHAEHHTAKHMAEMRKAMAEGKTFGEAHEMAMAKVGK